MSRDAGQVTVRQCLSHTSGLAFASRAELSLGGIERFAGTGFAAYRESGDDCVYDGLELRDAVASYDKELRFAPGTEFLYSNAGFNLVGHLIEVLSGESYASFVEARLLRPLGMHDTTLWPTEAQLVRLAKGYASANERSGSSLREVRFPQLTAPYSSRRTRGASPAGGFFSTARDCARFGRMMLRGGELDGRRYLSAGAVAAMTSDQTNGRFDWGLGWRLRPASADDAASGGFGHSGQSGRASTSTRPLVA